MSLWGGIRGTFLSDEERGKKDDDHKTAGKYGAGRPPAHWQPAARGPARRSLKRIAIALVILVAVYLFVQNIPTDLGPNPSLRPTYAGTSETGGKSKAPPLGGEKDRARPLQAAPSPKQSGQDSSSSPHDRSDTVTARTYNAPPRFLELASTLQAISGTNGGSPQNRNVLFAASSLKSVAALLPVACQMGMELRNYVHFAVMSPTETAMEDLAKLNGIDQDCHILFHDARPDFVSTSTEERLEYSVFRAFHHIQVYIHPQAIIIDSSEEENGYLQRGSRAQAKATGNTLIELPKNAAKGLAWMTKLDSASLHAWNKHHIDILIHASSGGSGSLIRLLRSLSMADYTSSSVPHVTIELPHDIDPPTKHFLESFKWPPVHAHGPSNAHYLSLRHRIPMHRVTEEESSSRFLESFWPADPKDSHVLVLSPNVEISPQFFHYLRYSLMEYKYSTAARIQNWGARLMGISLEQPLTPLNGGKALDAPRQTIDTKADVPMPFLWQAPTSNAMLFMGDKWAELHDFVSRCLEAQHRLDSTPALLSEKLVSTLHPSWLEHALRLSRLRGYWTVYPGEETAKSLATVHNELHHPPEEYADEETARPLLGDDASDKEVDEAMRRYKAGTETTLAPFSLLQSLPKNGGLEPFTDMAMFAWDGKKTDLHGLDSQVANYRTEFKKQVGGCKGEDTRKVVSLSTRDLFCATE